MADFNVNITNYNKMLEFLKTLDKDKFSFHKVVDKYENGCGTVCCVVGWFPKIFPDLVEWTATPSKFNDVLMYYIKPKNINKELNFDEIASPILNIDDGICGYLFTPNRQDLLTTMSIVDDEYKYLTPKATDEDIEYLRDITLDEDATPLEVYVFLVRVLDMFKRGVFKNHTVEYFL